MRGRQPSEQFGVQQFGEDLQRLDQSRSGAIEVRRPIAREHLTRANGPQVAPTRLPGQTARLLKGPQEIEPTGGH